MYPVIGSAFLLGAGTRRVALVFDWVTTSRIVTGAALGLLAWSAAAISRLFGVREVPPAEGTSRAPRRRDVTRLLQVGLVGVLGDPAGAATMTDPTDSAAGCRCSVPIGAARGAAR